MDIDNIRLKFLNSSWEEIIEIINLRLGVTQEEYLEDLKTLNSANEVVGNLIKQSPEDIERDENLLIFGIAETNAKEIRVRETEKRKKLRKKLLRLKRRKIMLKLVI